eukprot:COSAG02_NODE_9931_length_2071_cov_1.788540_3_plen_119_part_00
MHVEQVYVPRFLSLVMMEEPSKFLRSLKNYDKDNISLRVAARIKAMIDKNLLNPDELRTYSVAASGLAVWLRAIVRYHDASRDISQVRIKLDELNQELQDLMKTHQELQALIKSGHRA